MKRSSKADVDDTAKKRMFGRWLHWYPEEHRWRYGPGMEQTFAERVEELRLQHGSPPVALFLLRELASVAIAGLRQRLADLARDACFSARTLAREPGFTLAAVATLALGIGATTAVFSAINAVLLQPLAFRDPDRLIRLFEVTPQGWAMGFSPPNLDSYRGQASLLEGMAAFGSTSLTLAGEEPQRIPAMRVTAGFFELLGIPLLAGRSFAAGEDLADTERVVILGQGLWQRRYQGSRDVVGRTIVLDGTVHTVVGVVPAGFEIASWPADLWVPWAFDERDLTERGRHWLQVVARLGPDAELPAAREELQSIAAGLAEAYPETNAGWGVMVHGLLEEAVLGVRKPLLMLFTAAAVVLLIACANVANLLLARSQKRAGEMATRAALGANRGRLVRQMLTENTVLAALGGLAALPLAWGGVRLLVGLAGTRLPRAAEVGIDLQVLVFAAALTLMCGLLVGLFPALRGSCHDLMPTLRNPNLRRITRHRPGLRSLLVAAEVALSLVLVVGACLLISSLWNLLQVEPGFDPEGLVAASISLPETRYQNDFQRAVFFSELVEQVQRSPRVEAAAATTMLPFTGSHTTSLEIPERDNEKVKGIERRHVTPGYFRTAGIPLLEGRALQANDGRDATPVVVVNRQLARRLFPGQDVVGKEIVWQGRSDRFQLRIVGVVGDVRSVGLDQEARPTIYLPIRQAYQPREMSLLARTRGRPAVAVPEIRRALRRLDPTLPLGKVATVQELLSGTLAPRRLSTLLLGLFASIAVLLAVVGISGVVSFTVGRRTHEVGVRLALGCGRAEVIALVVLQGMLPALAGLLLGTVLALAASRLLSSQLFGIGPADPLIFAGVCVLITAVSLLACYLPARRAAEIDPARVLRCE